MKLKFSSAVLLTVILLVGCTSAKNRPEPIVKNPILAQDALFTSTAAAPDSVGTLSTPVAAPGCPCGDSCTCTAKDCGSPSCPSLGKQEKKDKKAKLPKKAGCPCPCDCGCCESGVCICCRLTLAQAVEKAKRDKKSVVVWVGVVCPSKEKELSDVIHAYEDSGKDLFPKANIVAPYVAVGRVGKDGKIEEWRGFQGIPPVQAINAVLKPVQRLPRDWTAPDGISPPVRGGRVFQPMPFQPMPMMPFGGGFGGFGGFGGGGGGC